MRECGSCTKCCDGFLSGEVNGHKFHGGVPCFYSTKKGCAIYKDRPHDPCKTFSCQWLINEDIPFWMKPDEVNAIIVKSELASGTEYIKIVEAGEKLRIEVFNWVIRYCLSRSYNIAYKISGDWHYIGTHAFITEFEKGLEK